MLSHLRESSFEGELSVVALSSHDVIFKDRGIPRVQPPPSFSRKSQFLIPKLN